METNKKLLTQWKKIIAEIVGEELEFKYKSDPIGKVISKKETDGGLEVTVAIEKPCTFGGNENE